MGGLLDSESLLGVQAVVTPEQAVAGRSLASRPTPLLSPFFLGPLADVARRLREMALGLVRQRLLQREG